VTTGARTIGARENARMTHREAGTVTERRQTIGGLLEAARSRLDRLEPQAALQAQADGALIVDTRCDELRRDDGVIPGSVHVPLSVLYWRLDPSSGYSDPALTDTGRRIVLCCAHGYSSSMAAATLRELGFDRATDIVGGFEAWAAAGLPVARLRRRPRVDGAARRS
jgi:rhodanese-related sulfurtransferase